MLCISNNISYRVSKPICQNITIATTNTTVTTVTVNQTLLVWLIAVHLLILFHG